MRYMLRVRLDDRSEWGPPTEYRTRKQRDRDASFNRMIGGLRTHSYEERGKCGKAESASVTTD